MRRRRLLPLALAAAACAPAPTGPPEVRLGVDECSHCRMIVSELTSAAVARAPDGREDRFDDLACLAGFARAGGADGWTVWVRAADTGGWTDAAAAWYRREPRRVTPMGSGLVAFASPPREGPAARSWADFLAATETTFEEAADEVQTSHPHPP